MHIAMPMPPPMHSVARPFLASRFCISCSSVTSTRAPDAPTGWPIAIAPPLTLTLPVSQPRSLLTAQACAANASLASIKSRTPIFVGADDDVALAGLDRDWNDLVRELAGLLRSLGLVLRGNGELVLLRASDLVLAGDVLGGVAHVEADKGV